MFENIGTTISTGVNDLVGAWLGVQTAAVTAQTVPPVSQPVAAPAVAAPMTVFGFKPMTLAIGAAGLVGLILLARR